MAVHSIPVFPFPCSSWWPRVLHVLRPSPPADWPKLGSRCLQVIRTMWWAHRPGCQSSEITKTQSALAPLKERVGKHHSTQSIIMNKDKHWLRLLYHVFDRGAYYTDKEMVYEMHICEHRSSSHIRTQNYRHSSRSCGFEDGCEWMCV